MTLQHLEKRRHPRQEVFNAVMISRNHRDRHSAMALDLSASGVRIGLLDSWRPAVGSPVRISFLFYADHMTVLEGRVTRISDDELGVEFLPAQEKPIGHLLDVVSRFH